MPRKWGRSNHQHHIPPDEEFRMPTHPEFFPLFEEDKCFKKDKITEEILEYLDVTQEDKQREWEDNKKKKQTQ